MDVLCVGMYRACSTWQYEVAAQLLARHRGARRLGYLTGEESARRGQSEGWAVLKSHEGHRDFRRSIGLGRAVAIYAHRDLRDVVFSLMHKRAISFEETLARGMVHQILANDRFWRCQPATLVQRYDRLVGNPSRGVREIAHHLGLTIGTEEADAIAAEYSFEENRRRVEALGARLRSTVGRLDSPEFTQVYDPESLLHWNHLRDGRVGGWRQLATSRHLAAIDRIAGPWLAENGYEPSGRVWDASPAERRRLALDVARGDLACRLRCLSLRFPGPARWVKRLAFIPVEAPGARAAGGNIGPDRRVDGSDAHRPVEPKPSEPGGRRGVETDRLVG